MLRLFVALRLPHELREALSTLCRGVDGARWQTPEQMHLTLRFIGEVKEQRAEDVHHALSDLRFTPFEISVRDVGYFGEPYKPRALWAGVDKSERLTRLADKVDQALIRIGFTPERRKFTPHITLARFGRSGAARIERYVRDHNELSLPPIPVDHFSLFSSQLSSSGPRYNEMATYPDQGFDATFVHEDQTEEGV